MKILFIKKSKTKLGQCFEAGQFGYFTNEFAREKIKAGEAVEIPPRANIGVINEILKAEISKLRVEKEEKKKNKKH